MGSKDEIVAQVTASEAARMLGVTRQRFAEMVKGNPNRGQASQISPVARDGRLVFFATKDVIALKKLRDSGAMEKKRGRPKGTAQKTPTMAERVLTPASGDPVPADKSWILHPPDNAKLGHHRRKLSDEDLIDIRLARENGWTIKALVEKYKEMGKKVSYATMQTAAKGRLRKPEHLNRA